MLVAPIPSKYVHEHNEMHIVVDYVDDIYSTIVCNCYVTIVDSLFFVILCLILR